MRSRTSFCCAVRFTMECSTPTAREVYSARRSCTAASACAGEALVRHCLQTAATLGFRLMQFNAVVKENRRALHLYEKLGFQRIGEVPGGFLMKDGHYADIVLFYYVL